MWKRDFSIFYPGSESYPACTVIAINLAHLLAAGINRNLGVRVFRFGMCNVTKSQPHSSEQYFIYHLLHNAIYMSSTCTITYLFLFMKNAETTHVLAKQLRSRADIICSGGGGGSPVFKAVLSKSEHQSALVNCPGNNYYLSTGAIVKDAVVRTYVVYVQSCKWE